MGLSSLPDIGSFDLQHQRLDIVVSDSFDMTIAHLEEKKEREHFITHEGEKKARVEETSQPRNQECSGDLSNMNPSQHLHEESSPS